MTNGNFFFPRFPGAPPLQKLDNNQNSRSGENTGMITHRQSNAKGPIVAMYRAKKIWASM
jgi:hypothetical protein